MEDSKKTETKEVVSSTSAVTPASSTLQSNKMLLIGGGVVAALIIVVLAAVVLMGGSKSESLKETFETDAYSFKYPETWETEESSDGGVTLKAKDQETPDLSDIENIKQTQVSVMVGNDDSSEDEDKKTEVIDSIKDGKCEDVKDLLSEELTSSLGSSGLSEEDLNFKIAKATIDSNPACKINMAFEFLGLKAKVEGYVIITEDGSQQFTTLVMSIGNDSKGFATGKKVIESFEVK